jgi:hypothetical protein
MKATDLLVNQHHDIEQIENQLERADPGDRAALRQELARTLVAHTAIETEIFYPALMQAMGSTERLRESFEEHALQSFALKKLIGVRPDDPSFHAKLAVLRKLVAEHVREEENDLLPQSEGALGDARLEQLGDAMEIRFDAVFDHGYLRLLDQSLGLTPARGRAAAKKTARRPQAKKTARRPAAKLAPRAKRVATKPAARPSPRAERVEPSRAAPKRASRKSPMSRAAAAGRAPR